MIIKKLKILSSIAFISLFQTCLLSKDYISKEEFINITNYDKDMIEKCITVSSKRNNIPEIIIKSIINVENRLYLPYAINCNTNIRPYTKNKLDNYKRYIECGDNVDIGVMQVNYSVWKRKYSNITTKLMLDPCVNIELGSKILKDNYKETKDWLTAIGYYHSRTPIHTEKYKSLVSKEIISVNKMTN